MSMEPCALAKTCLMDRRCVDYHQCAVERDTEATIRTEERAETAARFRDAVLDGLDQLERHNIGRYVSPGDVADLIHAVAAEVGRS